MRSRALLKEVQPQKAKDQSRVCFPILALEFEFQIPKNQGFYEFYVTKLLFRPKTSVFMLPPVVLIFLSNKTIFPAVKKIYTCLFMSLMHVYKFSNLQNNYGKSRTEAMQTAPALDILRSLDFSDFLGSLSRYLAYSYKAIWHNSS